MKRFTGFLILLMVFGVNSLFAQKVRGTSSFELGLLNIGYTQEFPVSQNTTMIVYTGLEGSANYSNSRLNYAFVPAFGVEPRIYYNIAKRASQKKNTAYNSANYVALSTYYTFGKSFSNYNFIPEPSFMISPLWGLQRAIGKHILYHIAAGPLFYKTGKNVDITLNVDISFNFHLFKMK